MGEPRRSIQKRKLNMKKAENAEKWSVFSSQCDKRFFGWSGKRWGGAARLFFYFPPGQNRGYFQ